MFIMCQKAIIYEIMSHMHLKAKDCIVYARFELESSMLCEMATKRCGFRLG